MHPLALTDYALARQFAFLDEIECIALTADSFTDEEIQSWRTYLEQADVNGTFFGSVNQVMAVGRKPS